ncbi:uroporphyrinogen-III synthase [Thiothrix caldifontis]|jgi:Uroporphyrinogen-III synthase|uniref:Uroporphyrinogen-III synthase n=1 Tax=Thiothrix caldifontis TaxID=525918 RepID=A0A1H3X0J9_9GAMM|nr:uroporphyrinogen-III synthase [Thiothrix caldifontis]SDZ92929.1 uroporphyrinogen-III synthase [Thiothrix caldifontis]
MPKALHDLHVMVTRPAHQAEGFRQRLELAGAVVQLLPVVEVRPLENPQAALTTLAQLSRYDTAVFISANAVNYGLSLLDMQQGEVLQTLTLGAIGKQTARTLQQHGFTAHWIPQQGFTSEDFLALPQTKQLANRHILIFRGQGGRELLADTLRERGAQVTYVDVYQRVCPQIDANQLKSLHEQQQLDIISITSSEGLLNLLVMLGNPDWIKTVPLLVGSQRMLATARQAGFTGTIRIADNPGDEAMLQALLHWVQEFQP